MFKIRFFQIDLRGQACIPFVVMLERRRHGIVLVHELVVKVVGYLTFWKRDISQGQSDVHHMHSKTLLIVLEHFCSQDVGCDLTAGASKVVAVGLNPVLSTQ